MKKNRNHGRNPFWMELPKIFRIMRLICLLLFGALIQVSAASYSQTKKVTVSGENLSFRDVLKIIEEQSEFSFFYNVNQLEAGKQFDLDFENESLESLMEVLLKDSELTYSVNDRLVIIHREEDAGLVENMVKQKAVSGTVTDAGGNPLPGVTVVVKGTTKGTITNEEGGYLLQDVPEDATLVFSFVGMISREVTVGTQKVIDVTLEQDVIGIEEVVAIGYGTVKKSDLTGAVASVSEDRLEMKPNVNIAEAIQGAIPGILVTQTSARAAPEQSIMIRGRNSITAGNNPLIIVDGIPYNGGLNDFNPSDVESIDVLKDASSTAIYGSRGANGVIIITTKKGTKGKAKLTYDGKYSLKTAYNFPETMTGEEFYQYKNTIDPGAFKPKELEI